ncbi:CSMD [Mytilus coruscus]|uniref:CSMD n=1 Tax=Mytilus coruscus TaxID=42192 RepID=A0A6J8B044_MYTCO|nr:CSMD [Mytilus coruscus]
MALTANKTFLFKTGTINSPSSKPSCNSTQPYAVLNGSSIHVPGVNSSPDFGYVEVTNGNSITIQNTDGNMDGDDAMTWVFYVRMTSPQTATFLQYTGSSASHGFTFGINGNALYVSFLDTYYASYSFTSKLTIPVDGSWVFIGFTFNKLWTNDDHIDLIYFQDGIPITSTFGLGTASVSVDAHGDIIIGKTLDNKQPFTGDITCIQFYNTSLLGGTLRDSIELCDPTLNTLPVIECGNPDIPNNSRVVVQDYYYSNLSAVVCDVGYAVSSGDAIRRCTSSGFWNGTKPVCSLADWKYDPNGGHGNFSHLLIDKSTLSKQRRLLFSVYERNTSKIALGVTGIIIMIILCFYIICMDCLSLLRSTKRDKEKHLTI